MLFTFFLRVRRTWPVEAFEERLAPVFCSLFHWVLEFPEVFFNEDGSRKESPGFDCVLGNPPWDKIKQARVEFFARHNVRIRAYKGRRLSRRVKEICDAEPSAADCWEEEQRRVKSYVAALTGSRLYRYHMWAIDGKSTGGAPDIFKFFLERAWQLQREGGHAGIVTRSLETSLDSSHNEGNQASTILPLPASVSS